MRWCSFTLPHDDGLHIGVLQAGEVHVSRKFAAILELLGDDGSRLTRAGDDALADPLEVLPFDALALTAPIPVPPSIRDFMAFEDHLKPILAARGAEMDPAWYEIPAFYFTNPAAVLGPTDDVHAAPGGTDLDFELEVAAVVGRAADNVDVATAGDLVAGYVLMSDWSARDLQRRERGIGLGPTKGKDWATSFGPLFVTPDELPRSGDRQSPSLRLTASVNGRQYSDGNLDELYWSFEEMISYAARGTQVRAGDIIGSGTVGTGCIADLAARHGSDIYPWLKPGDQISLAADLLGSIDVRLVEAVAAHPLR